jgi:hypothetical protein
MLKSAEQSTPVTTRNTLTRAQTTINQVVRATSAPTAQTTINQVVRAFIAPTPQVSAGKYSTIEYVAKTGFITPAPPQQKETKDIANTTITDTETGQQMAVQTATQTPQCNTLAPQRHNKNNNINMSRTTTADSSYTLDTSAQYDEDPDDDEIPYIKQTARVNDNIWNSLNETASAILKFLSTTSSAEVVIYTQERVHADIKEAQKSIGDNVCYGEAVFQSLELKSFSNEHYKDNDQALKNGKSSDDLINEAAAPIHNKESSADKLRSYLKNRRTKNNGSREITHGGSYLYMAPICNHATVKLIESREAIVFRNSV